MARKVPASRPGRAVTESFETAREELGRWIAETSDGPVLETVPGDGDEEGKAVHLALLDVESKANSAALPPGGGRSRPPLEVALRYLVAAGASPESHGRVVELLFAARSEGRFEVDPAPPPLALWRVLGATPRPAFLLRTRLRRTRPRPEGPRVEEPIELHLVPTTGGESPPSHPEPRKPSGDPQDA